jgi:hypothetical protein
MTPATSRPLDLSRQAGVIDCAATHWRAARAVNKKGARFAVSTQIFLTGPGAHGHAEEDAVSDGARRGEPGAASAPRN